MTYKLSNLSVANEGYTNLTNYGVSLAILTFFNRRCRRLVCCRFRWREFPTARRCYSRHRRRSGSARRHGRGRLFRRHRQRSSLKKMKKKKTRIKRRWRRRRPIRTRTSYRHESVDVLYGPPGHFAWKNRD